ncbi:cell envelope integrity protein TolA, partial [Escherichia coli]|uniref:cell envelope integrity protein TolA n=1 Tax=Escherichia coli TaxID=562 RepID=UPI003DA0809E
MMNILHFSQSVKWSSWFICSLLLHGLIFLAFIWRFSEVQPAMSPAPAIMLQWAEIIEAPSSPLSLPVGIAQQESAVTEEKQQTEDRQQRPVTEDSDATIEITRKKKGTVAKLAMRQPFVLFKGLTFQKLCLPGAFRPGDHHNKMLRPL